MARRRSNRWERDGDGDVDERSRRMEDANADGTARGLGGHLMLRPRLRSAVPVLAFRPVVILHEHWHQAQPRISKSLPRPTQAGKATPCHAPDMVGLPARGDIPTPLTVLTGGLRFWRRSLVADRSPTAVPVGPARASRGRLLPFVPGGKLLLSGGCNRTRA